MLANFSDLPKKFAQNIKCLRQLDCKFFDSFWARIEPDKPVDYAACQLGEGVNNFGNTWKGMICNDTKERLGIFRCLTKHSVGYATRIDEKTTHGLCIEVFKDEFKIGIVVRNREVFYLAFDASGTVSARKDKENLFADVNPDTFLRQPLEKSGKNVKFDLDKSN